MHNSVLAPFRTSARVASRPTPVPFPPTARWRTVSDAKMVGVAYFNEVLRRVAALPEVRGSSSQAPGSRSAWSQRCFWRG
jgi:hypothetical protein